jgi:hypothetical protein
VIFLIRALAANEKVNNGKCGSVKMEQSLNKSSGNQSPRKSKSESKSKSKSVVLPMSTDWRKVNDLDSLTPIKDEGFISCLAFSNTPTLEAWGWKSNHTNDNRCVELPNTPFPNSLSFCSPVIILFLRLSLILI